MFLVVSGACLIVRRIKGQNNGIFSIIADVQPRRIKLDVPNLELQLSKLDYQSSKHRRYSRGIADDDARATKVGMFQAPLKPIKRMRAKRPVLG